MAAKIVDASVALPMASVSVTVVAVRPALGALMCPV